MYTHTDKQPVGCNTYSQGWQNCNACIYRDDPLGCDGFTTEEGAVISYSE